MLHDERSDDVPQQRGAMLWAALFEASGPDA